MTFNDIKRKLDNNEITYDEVLNQTNKEIEKQTQTLNFEIARLEVKTKPSKDLPLYGAMLGVKDAFSIKGENLSVSSETLDGAYTSPFNATSIQNLLDAGATLVSRVALDEFCMGGTGIHSTTGIVRNPWDTSRIAGGSSSGSASAVASGAVQVALGSDSGDSVRRPAAFNGIVGYKPSYGLISRYGISEYCASLDTAGTMARSVDDAAIVANYMMGDDPKDFSQSNQEVGILGLHPHLENKRIAIINEMYGSIEDQDIKNNFNKTINTLKNAGVTIEFVDFNEELLQSITTAYYVLSFSESTSSLARIDAINYGKRFVNASYETIIYNSRTRHTSEYVKMRFFLGSYFLNSENIGNVFDEAKRFRMLVKNEFDKKLSMYDAFIAPTTDTIAPDIEATVDDSSFRGSTSICEDSLLIANFLGLPSISIPSGFKDEMPIGVCLTGPAFTDRNILEMAKGLEDLLGYKGMKAGDKYE